MRLKPHTLLLGLGLLLSGCATASQTTANAGLTQSPGPVPLPPMVMTGHPTAPEPQADARTSRFMFRDTPVSDALRLLFKGSGMNLVLASGITGTVTADFIGMAPEQVLGTVLKNHGLSVSYQDGIAHVGPEGSRTFKLDYVAGDKHNKIWKEITTQLSALLSESGQLTVSHYTGTLIVSDTPERMNMVEAHLAKLQEIIGRQVLLEAKVIEVTLNDKFELGIDYGAFPRTFGIGGSVAGNAGSGNALVQSLTPNVTGFNFGILRNNDFSVLLKALNTQGQVNMLSAPKVSTLNNRTAVINITEQIPVISREVITGDLTTATRELYDVSFEDAGIRLDVTPQIGADGTMTVVMHPVVTEKTGEVTTPDGLQTLPVINQRETESVVRVADGESILMGGFIQNRMTEAVSKVPGLGDLPGLGALFRRTVQDKKRVELVILLTPKIMDPERIAATVRDALVDVKHLARKFHFGLLGNETFDPEALHGLSGFVPVATKQAINPSAPGGFMPVSQKGLAWHTLNTGLKKLEQGDSHGAEIDFLTALEIAPGFAEAHFQLALVYAGRGYGDQTMRQFEQVAATRPDHPWGLNRLALALTGSGDFDAAVRVLRHALSQFPDHPALLTNLGVAYLGKNMPELAEVAFRRANRLHPEAVEPILNRAELLAARGESARAAAMLESALDRMVDNPEFFLRVKRRIGELAVPGAPAPAPTSADADADQHA